MFGRKLHLDAMKDTDYIVAASIIVTMNDKPLFYVFWEGSTSYVICRMQTPCLWLIPRAIKISGVNSLMENVERDIKGYQTDKAYSK